MEPVLIEVRNLTQDGRLRLTWSDGHSAEFEYGYLRGWCPCAGCQGHGGLTLRYHPAPGPVRVQSVQAVGNYAISLAFSDGHSTGIYRFDLLRRICPCAACRAGAAGSDSAGGAPPAAIDRPAGSVATGGSRDPE